ncbi:unnamed protein product [Prorocentrum cordatum]|uniref:HEAT repeat-containing protein 1 n=1 Tax=Prorocentrum cordatum TaxID=2364126 RepID=A0ABN9VU17_9DINO|nr:unnamed protein product [Polarella glacialis]
MRDALGVSEASQAMWYESYAAYAHGAPTGRPRAGTGAHAANTPERRRSKGPVPLAEFQKGWQARSPHDALLDRVVGPMVHDALRAGLDVFLASLAVLDALLQDPRTASLDQDEFVALFRGRQMLLPVEEAQAGNADDDCLLALLDQAEEGGGSSKASSPHQAAAAAICSCIRSGKLPLSEAAWPLLGRIDDRLRSEAAQGKMDKKEAALGPKCLATNFRLLGGWIREFGLQSGGLFRRALVLPLVLRGLASEHSKVRAAAGEALVPMLAAGGDLEERLWALLPSKRRRAAKELLASQEMPPGPCHDDLVPKTVVVSTDARAAGFTCASELTAEVWAGLLAGQEPGAAPPQPQLSQYVLCGYQVSLLQSSLVSFLGDSVTAVFIAAADLLQKVCERVPADAAAAVWEPSMGPLIARLPDTSAKVRAKASEAILALAGLHAGAVGEAVAAAVAGPGPAGEAADAGRCAGPRLQLLARLLRAA